MIRGGKRKKDDREEINKSVKRSIQIVRGHHDFRGELIEMPGIDGDGLDYFDSSPTEMNMEVGIGRHDKSLEFLIYDHVVAGSQFVNLSRSLGRTQTTGRSFSISRRRYLLNITRIILKKQEEILK